MQQLEEQRRNAKEPENPTSQRTKTQLRRSRRDQKRSNCWTCKINRIPQPPARGRPIKDQNNQRTQHYLGKMETLPKRKRKWLCQSEHPCTWNTKTRKTEPKTQTPKPRVGTHARPLDDAVLEQKFNDLRNQYNSNRNNTVTIDVPVCHASCHSSCHGSRGRR